MGREVLGGRGGGAYRFMALWGLSFGGFVVVVLRPVSMLNFENL